MKKVVNCLLLVLIFSTLVLAGSEVTTNFVIGNDKVKTVDYVPVNGFWSIYGDFVVGVLFALIVVCIVFNKMKKFSKIKSISRKKGRKAKKRK